MRNNYDIIIIGGGIAGCISAMYLHHFYKILVIEKIEDTKTLHGETLVASSRRIFNELDINLDSIMQDEKIGKDAIGMQSYWGTDLPMFQDSIRNPEGNGWSIEKNKFVNALQSIVKEKNITFIREEIHQIEEINNQWVINTKNCDGIDKSFCSNFIIDTSGRRSLMAKKLNLKRKNKDQLIGIHASIKIPTSLELSTIYPCKNGWWYVAKLPNKKHLISFFTDSDLCDKKLTNDADHFKSYFLSHTELNQILALDKNDFDYNFLGTKASYSSIIEPSTYSNWIAIGDSCITFDPLSSQGMYNALAMAGQISKLIIKSNVIHTLSDDVKKSFQVEYQRMIKDIWSHYEYHYYIYYSMEKRWANEKFWSRRQKI